MDKSRKFQDLVVWQKSHKLVLEIYKVTYSFPKDEIFGLTSQIRRAAVSVPANIVEGYKRRSKAEKVRFFNISQASLEEVRYYLILAEDLDYAKTEKISEQLDEVAGMLAAYINKIGEK
jgi:four helix bundle protein